MSWNTIKIDAADKYFSLYIRARDKRCVNPKCQRPGQPNEDDLPVLGLQCSHFYGRRAESTRYEPDNTDALCANCHRLWGGELREDYKAFKLKQLGKKRFDSLMVQHNTAKKKDRKMSLLVAKALLKTL